MAVNKKIKYILIDGLRGVPSEMDKSGRYWEDERYLSSCLDHLQKLAKYLDVVFIVEHSPNRNIEKRKNKRPNITDLRLDLDLLSKVNSIIMLYRDSYYGISHGNDNNKLDLEIQVIKTGKIELDRINPKVQEC